MTKHFTQTQEYNMDIGFKIIMTITTTKKTKHTSHFHFSLSIWPKSPTNFWFSHLKSQSNVYFDKIHGFLKML